MPEYPSTGATPAEIAAGLPASVAGGDLDLPATRSKWTPRRQWVTRFDDQVRDAAQSTLTGLSYASDASPVLATLSSPLSTAAAITALPVNALGAAIAAGTYYTVSGTNTQAWVTTGAAQGATSLPVTSQTPNFAYPAATPLGPTVVSCVKLTASGTVGTAVVSQPLKNVDVRIRYRMASDATYTLTYAWIACLARYVATSLASSGAAYAGLGRSMFAMDDWWHSSLQTDSQYAGVSGISAGTGSVAPKPVDSAQTDIVDDRYLRFRVIDDVMYAKNWLLSADEPDAWQIIVRSRPSTPGGATPITLTADDIQMGTAGLYADLTAALFKELVVTELENGSQNMLTNPTFTEVETSVTSPAGSPIGWFPLFSPGSGGSLGVVQIQDRFGITRPALQIVAGSGSTGPQWVQRIWNTLNRGGNAGWPRLSPYPCMQMAPWIEIRLWSQGINIVNATPSNLNLAADVDNYYYDNLGAQVNRALDGGGLSIPDYFSALAPNTTPLDCGTISGSEALIVNAGGAGSWGWTETVFRMKIRHWEAIAFMDFAIALHDPGVTGTLNIMDPVVRPVY